MAGTARTTKRVNSYRDRQKLQMGYEDGSAVRKLQEIPREEQEQQLRRRVVRRPAPGIGLGYVLFLSVICAATLLLCVTFLRQRSLLTTQYEDIARLESEYTQLKSDNDARYQEVLSSVTLEDIKEAALERLGMHYADAGQIQYYELTEDSYVRQYKEVPSSGQ